MQQLLSALSEARRAVAGARHASRHHADLARLLGALGEQEEAVEVLRDALQTGGGTAADFEALGFAAFGVNDHQLALSCYAKVVELAPRDALARYNLASCERNLGRLSDAEASCDAALALDDQAFQAALLRSQLRTQTATNNHLAELMELARRHSTAVNAQIFLSYALGKELEDIGRYDEAFAHFQAGATARRRELAYDVGRDLAILARVAEVYDAASLRSRPTDTRGEDAFIVGLPRSGTTLIERVLTGLPTVRTNGETDNFATALMQAVPDGAGDLFARAARADSAAVAATYRRLAGNPGVPGGLVLEKLPLNYLYLGAIAQALPDAPIVLLRRHPLDSCLAMYTTLFGVAYPFSYDLEELGRYYAAFDRLMDHWRSTLGEQLLVVQYEDFVTNPDREGARIAAHVKLDWRPDALRIEENASPSTTASAVQIRRPIYRTAAGRWRRYDAHLAPLKGVLGAEGIQID